MYAFFPQELNRHLSSCIYLVGYKLTLADMVLYYGLHKYLVSFVQILCWTIDSLICYDLLHSESNCQLASFDFVVNNSFIVEHSRYITLGVLSDLMQARMSFTQKAQCPHVCRWFDHVSTVSGCVA